MKIYHYNKIDKTYAGESDAKKNPLEEGEFLVPAKATTVKPEEFKEGFINIFNGEVWELKRVKTPQPSKYHTWTGETGWIITSINQKLLDADIAKELATEEQNNLIELEIRQIAINSLKEKGELPIDFI